MTTDKIINLTMARVKIENEIRTARVRQVRTNTIVLRRFFAQDKFPRKLNDMLAKMEKCVREMTWCNADFDSLLGMIEDSVSEKLNQHAGKKG